MAAFSFLIKKKTHKHSQTICDCSHLLTTQSPAVCAEWFFFYLLGLVAHVNSNMFIAVLINRNVIEP